MIRSHMKYRAFAILVAMSRCERGLEWGQLVRHYSLCGTTEANRELLLSTLACEGLVQQLDGGDFTITAKGRDYCKNFHPNRA